MPHNRALQVAAVGLGVDSVAMVIEMVSRGDPIDLALFADTMSERPETYAYLPVFQAWCSRKGVDFHVVNHQVKDFRNYPRYSGLEENCITNGTLPGISFGRKSCSQKHKVEVQNRYVKRWQPAIDEWSANRKVVKLIGFDSSPADNRRYANREGHVDDRYEYRYPLREWGWDRARCAERILAEGLPVPVKSACFFCLATHEDELRKYPAALLRRIVLMEARAAPRLRTVEGLWRTSRKGVRGKGPRPGSMTRYIVEKGLLDEAEVDRIVALAPQALLRWQDAVREAGLPPERRPRTAEWMAMFDLLAEGGFQAEGVPDLFGIGLDGQRPTPVAEAGA